MGKSYRIAANVGVDKNLTLQVEQDFEQLEILSLKLRQEEIYPRNCSDYGVVVGRIFVNNGYGLPNAKVSVFIPLSTEDENNPVIDSIYPYKTLSDVNEDGYKYNLLPYEPSYSGHTPTGTFPTRTDALTNNTAVELYDKYYKFTVTTNDSGDFMIFGVPTGTQTLVMNVDLSDIGEFSLTPQDLIRMGVAVESQFDGNKFKSSENFQDLPQIIVLSKTITVSPFWGQEDVCQIGITRTDFDLTAEANIEIMPTSVFMGSIISTSERDSLKTDCIPENSCGNLCNLVAGPGEIIGIRQTIFLDDEGKPVLEVADLPNGGRVIDENGVWLLDLPMNLDYIYTNEFGQKVISNDPTLGIPTKGKYRFKVKWQQSSSLSEGDRRAYFLVPNVREYGWDENNPDLDPMTGVLGQSAFELAQKSYAFSLDWSAYTDYNVAVNCEDYFYQFDYNKVYTISQLIDNIKTQEHREKFIGIKRVDDPTCEENVNKFPVNDGVFHASFMWTIIDFLLLLFNIISPVIMFFIHLFSLLLFILAFYFGFLAIQTGIEAGLLYAAAFGTVPIPSANIPLLVLAIVKTLEAIAYITFIVLIALIPPPKTPFCLPMLTYPQCEACDCSECNSEQTEDYQAQLGTVVQQSGLQILGPTFLIPFNSPNVIQSLLSNESYFDSEFSSCGILWANDLNKIKNLLIGQSPSDVTPLTNPYVPVMDSLLYTDDLPMGERINAFNTKGKYFEQTGLNKISVSFSNNLLTEKHYDNTLTVVANSQIVQGLNAGDMITFVDRNLSSDPNITGGPTNSFLTNAITGTTNYPLFLNVTYANTPTTNTSITYLLPPITQTNQLLYSYQSDIEYFQVITALTLNEFFNLSNPNALNDLPGSFANILSGSTEIFNAFGSCATGYTIEYNQNYLNDYKVLIIQRGVDPYSPKEYPVAFGLGKLFGYANENQISITNSSVKYRLNVPIKAGVGGLCYDHSNLLVGQTNLTVNNGQNLFFPSYFFLPGSDYSGYTSTLHRYYSSLDGNRLSFQVQSTSSPLSNYVYIDLAQNNVIKSNDDTDAIVGNIFYGNKVNSQYQSVESLDGGSFMRVRPYPINSPINDFYFSPTYLVTSPNHLINMSSPQKIVMRSDRLPTSSSFITAGTYNNVFLLQQNNNFTYYLESGEPVVVNTGVSAPSIGGQGNFTATANTVFNNILNTFDCKNMVQLSCFSGNGNSFGIKQDCEKNDAVVGGCYQFVKNPIFGLNQDVENIKEWGYRMRFFYGLCSGVLSHVFNNNWINGTLFAYSYRLDADYDLNNNPTFNFCATNLVYHNDTNNIYYRSSPYVDDNIQFIGQPSPSQNTINRRNLMNPTTILNLGPKVEFLKYVSLNENFEGYNINKITSSSYGNSSDLVNFFAVTRIASGNNNWSNGISTNLITSLFSRTGTTGTQIINTQRVDADFAQLQSINSELGVVKFDANAYNTGGPKPSAFSINPLPFPNNLSFLNVMGVFFSSSTIDIQSRDYISPVRIIRFNQNTSNFSYDYLNVSSQKVPMYKWGIVGQSVYGIFGGQFNDWRTDINDIHIERYQSLDRIVNDPYFYAGDLANQYNYRGYIWAVQGGSFFNGNYAINSNTVVAPNKVIVGAPWHFYFGLRRGTTAINRFYTQYIGEEVI